MPLVTTSLQRVQQSVSRMDQWIEANKPSRSKSQEVFIAFMEFYGPGITGSNAFVAMTKRMIKKASCLATGVTIMERLLSTGRDMPTSEGATSYFETDTSSLYLNVSSPKRTYICLDNQGQRGVAREPSRVVTLIHEWAHALSAFTDAAAYRARGDKLGSLPEMDSGEEERAITGDLHLEEAADADFCCENTALREFSCPPRINHRGINSSVDPDLHDLVEHRILPKIRELSQSRQIHDEKKEGVTPLELALFLYLLEKHPEALQEWKDTIRILIPSGCQLDSALKIAILLNSEELMTPLLEAGANLTEEMLDHANKGTSERFDEMWNMLEQTQWVVTNKTIEELFHHGYVIPPDKDPSLFRHPAIKAMDKQAIQRANVRAKFSDERTLPVHTLEKLFRSRDLAKSGEIASKEVFAHWTQSHPPSATPLERALFLHLLEEGDSFEASEKRMDTIRTLIQSGGPSESALKIAILLNSRELMDLLLQEGTNLTEEMLEYTTREIPERLYEMWKMLEQAQLVVTGKSIEDLQHNRADAMEAKLERAAQHACVEAKFSDEGTLPVHTMRDVFYHSFYRRKLEMSQEKFFNKWDLSHSYRAPRVPPKVSSPPRNPSPPSNIQSPPSNIQEGEQVGLPCLAIERPSPVFEFRPDGSCVPTSNYHSCYPQCHKSFENFPELYQPRKRGIRLDGHVFTLAEIESFIKTTDSLDVHHINSIAWSLSGEIMEELKIGNAVENSENGHSWISKDAQLSKLLSHLISAQIRTALSSPATLLDGTKLYYSPTYYVDIPILSEEGDGLLQQIKHALDGKYLNAIESLKTEEGKPISSAVCRFMLKERPISTSHYLHFARAMLINGNTVKEIGWG